MIKKGTGNEEDERPDRLGKQREDWTSMGIKLEETKQKRSNQGSNKDGWMDGLYITLAGTASGTGIAAMAVLSFAACSFVPVFHRILGRVSRLI